jgi:hypothetical protein
MAEGLTGLRKSMFSSVTANVSARINVIAMNAIRAAARW